MGQKLDLDNEWSEKSIVVAQYTIEEV